MKVYHMSQTLKLGDELQAGYKRNIERCKEFAEVLERGEKYLQAKIAYEKTKTNDWREYVKWCVEGVFEFIRKTEFPSHPSRLNCNYYFASFEHFNTLYESGWAQEPEEERAKIRLYEIELADEHPIQCDMLFFDEAYDVMLETQDIKLVIELVRGYFEGKHTTTPIWEIISDKTAKAVKDITYILDRI